MKRVLTLAFIVALGYSIAAIGQNTTPAVPDPASLTADWWSYFVVDKEQDKAALTERVDKAVKLWNGIKQAAAEQANDELAAKLDHIVSLALSFETIRGAAEIDPLPQRVARERYFANDYSELLRQVLRAGYDHAALAEEDKALQDVLTEIERQQLANKTAYLEMHASAPDRLDKGVDLIDTRLQLEIGKERLRRLAAVKNRDAKHLERLRGELEAAESRLVADAAEIERWEQRAAEARENVAEFNRKLVRTRLEEPMATELTPEISAQSHLVKRRILLLETQSATAQATQMKATFMARLLELHADEERKPSEDQRNALQSQYEIVKALRARLAGWRRTVPQLRAQTQRQRLEASGTPLEEVYERALAITAEVEQNLPKLEEALGEAASLNDRLERLFVQRESGLERGVGLAKDAARSSWQTAKNVTTKSLFELGETPVTLLGLGRVILVLVVAFWISRLLRRALARVAERRENISQNSVYILGRVMHYVVLVLGIVIGLSSIGLDFTKFALFASALGVGIGFGLQTLVSNFVSGLIILFERSLKIGDFVELESGVHGEVKEINMRSTLINTNDNVDILVPNSEFVGGRVTNWTLREASRRVHIPFGVAYGTDKELVKKAALEAAEAVPWTQMGHEKRVPQVWFTEFGDSSLNFELVLWLRPEAVKRPSAVHAAYLWEIETKLREYDIEVPFPQRDLHLRSAFGKKDEGAWPLFGGVGGKT